MACDITPVQLQNEALALLQKEYPERLFRRGSTAEVIVMGEVELGLQNLRSKFCLAKPSLDLKARQEEMRTHFAAMMQLIAERGPKIPTTWGDAKDRVFPQLMSSDYLRPFNGARVLVTRPFVPGVQLAVAVDRANGYDYVREEDRKRWAVDENVLFETALRNLDLKKGNAKLQGGGDPDRFLAIEEKDGYDAVRLLIPWVRQEAAKFLGEPFLASVPNRDFLIMWSTKNSAGFREMAKSKTVEDFKSQPYPLSPVTLRVWGNGRIEVAQ
ncbi:MAG: hypothetical protein B0A82_11175 [Alkalinema sp. CACIAM 70d]|nr:MAG: hypothetical protein B0A82_11175 [Alkalinema sp. CACIAM 70d]